MKNGKQARAIGWVGVVAIIAAIAIVETSVAAPLNVMPLGDSNTVGTATAPNGYRARLWQDFGSDPTRVRFLGSQQSNPLGIGNHEGHNGYTIAAAPVGFGNITDNIASYLGPRVSPDVILLMIGTNDMNLNFMVDTAPARLDFLIGRISDLSTGLRSSARLLVASAPPIDDVNNQFRTGLDTMANSRVIAFNATIPAIVATHAARGEHVEFVDIYNQLSIADIEDGLHPKRAGYDKIGDAFYRAIIGVPEASTAVYLLLVLGWSVAAARRPRPVIRRVPAGTR